MKSKQPNAVEFAKTVLHHLCNLRAEVASLKAQIEDLQKASGHIPPAKTIRELELIEESHYKIGYRQACEFANLSSTPPGFQIPDDEL